MTVPESAVVLILTGILAVVGWGVKRLVKTNDETARALQSISGNLSTMNGRLGKSETWMEMHEKQDDDRHQETQRSHDAMWSAINGLRA